MKTIGLLILGISVLIAGAGYSLFLIDEQSRPTYACKSADYYHSKVEEAAQAYKAAKGTPQERDAEKKLKQWSENELTAIRVCAEDKSFYRNRIAVGFAGGAGGLLISLVGLGVLLFGRKKKETIE